MEENNHNIESKKEEEKSSCWAKFALFLIVLFLACYLAVYYILDQMRHSYYVPTNMENIDKILQEQDKMFNNMTIFPMHYNAMVNVKNPIEMYKDDKQNAYKIVVDLKPFDNNPENINVSIDDKKIDITGEAEKVKNHSENIFSISQSFMFPEKIDTDEITKEKSGNKYIITLPIDD